MWPVEHSPRAMRRHAAVLLQCPRRSPAHEPATRARHTNLAVLQSETSRLGPAWQGKLQEAEVLYKRVVTIRVDANREDDRTATAQWTRARNAPVQRRAVGP